MKKFYLFRITAAIALVAFLLFFSSSSCSSEKSKPAEPLDNSVKEADSSTPEEVDSTMLSYFEVDLAILMKSPMGSSTLAMSEEDLESIPAIPDGYESLNEVRFAGWSEDDFFYNDYLRAFRRYMDRWMQGKSIAETEFDPSALKSYKKRLNSKFVAYDVRAFMFGGLLYRLVPIDSPELCLLAWIYSVIDNDGHISEYQVQYVGVEWDVEEKLTAHGIKKDRMREAILDGIGDGVRSTLW